MVDWLCMNFAGQQRMLFEDCVLEMVICLFPPPILVANGGHVFFVLSSSAPNCTTYALCGASSKVLVANVSSQVCAKYLCSESECCTSRMFLSFM